MGTQHDILGEMTKAGEIEIVGDRVALSALGRERLDSFLVTLADRLALADVMLAHPDLSVRGFDRSDRAGFAEARHALAYAHEEFARARPWLERVPVVKKCEMPVGDARRIAEQFTHGQICAGAMLAAALSLGIRVHRPLKAGKHGAKLGISASPRMWPRQK